MIQHQQKRDQEKHQLDFVQLRNPIRTYSSINSVGRRLSRGTILAAKMAESGYQSTHGWPNDMDDYEVGEVIGLFK